MVVQDEAIETLEASDRFFRNRGAVAYHDEILPFRNTLGYLAGCKIFSRHYFNIRGVEIGMVHPEFLQYHKRVHVFETPRVWGFEHDMIPFKD